jgi:hypothetical protein
MHRTAMRASRDRSSGNFLRRRHGLRRRWEPKPEISADIGLRNMDMGFEKE